MHEWPHSWCCRCSHDSTPYPLHGNPLKALEENLHHSEVTIYNLRDLLQTQSERDRAHLLAPHEPPSTTVSEMPLTPIPEVGPSPLQAAGGESLVPSETSRKEMEASEESLSKSASVEGPLTSQAADDGSLELCSEKTEREIEASEEATDMDTSPLNVPNPTWRSMSEPRLDSEMFPNICWTWNPQFVVCGRNGAGEEGSTLRWMKGQGSGEEDVDEGPAIRPETQTSTMQESPSTTTDMGSPPLGVANREWRYMWKH